MFTLPGFAIKRVEKGYRLRGDDVLTAPGVDVTIADTEKGYTEVSHFLNDMEVRQLVDALDESGVLGEYRPPKYREWIRTVERRYELALEMLHVQTCRDPACPRRAGATNGICEIREALRRGLEA